MIANYVFEEPALAITDEQGNLIKRITRTELYEFVKNLGHHEVCQMLWTCHPDWSFNLLLPPTPEQKVAINQAVKEQINNFKKALTAYKATTAPPLVSGFMTPIECEPPISDIPPVIVPKEEKDEPPRIQ